MSPRPLPFRHPRELAEEARWKEDRQRRKLAVLAERMAAAAARSEDSARRAVVAELDDWRRRIDAALEGDPRELERLLVQNAAAYARLRREVDELG